MKKIQTMRGSIATAGFAVVSAAALATESPLLEFQLPLPGESIPAEGGGLLVQTDSTIRQVVFRWYGAGATPGTAEGNVQFEGFFQAQTGPLKPGDWTLEAQGFDATGKLVAKRTQVFNIGGAAPEASPRVVQDLYISSNAGLRFGAGESGVESYRSLKLAPGGSSVPGPAMEPFDQNAFGNATMVYRLQQGRFQLKVRGSTDASETWGHSQSPTRLGADMYWSDWAEAHLGDQYPAWSQLLMDGSRIRGVGAGVALAKDGSSQARAEFSIGTLRPAIDPQIRVWDGIEDTLPAQFGRSIQAFHLGVGDGSPLGWNLALIHSRDKTDGVDLELHDNLSGPTPRENLAVGTDLVSRLWKNRIELYVNSALSLTTDDTRQGSILDSLRDKEGMPLPSLLDDVASLNLSTRGVEIFSRGSSGTGDFLWENMALRTGGRFLFPLGDFGRMRLESRWIHVGTYFESFARGASESPRTGLEWSATSALARDALLVVVSGTETEAHPTMGASIPTHTINVNLAWTPVAKPLGWHLESGTLASGGGPQTRTESWNAGGGLFGTVRTAEHGSVIWRTGYGYYQNSARVPVTSFAQDPVMAADSQFSTRSYSTSVRTHSVDANLRWRPYADLEWRSGYMLSSQGIPDDTVRTEQARTHRIQGGVSFWRLSHRLELSLDGSTVIRPDQPGDDEFGWNQTARASFALADSKTVRASQRWARLAGGRDDLQFELGWEAWF